MYPSQLLCISQIVLLEQEVNTQTICCSELLLICQDHLPLQLIHWPLASPHPKILIQMTYNPATNLLWPQTADPFFQLWNYNSLDKKSGWLPPGHTLLVCFLYNKSNRSNKMKVGQKNPPNNIALTQIVTHHAIFFTIIFPLSMTPPLHII